MRRTMEDLFGEWAKVLEPVTLGFEDFFNDIHGRAQRYKVGGYPPYNMSRTEDGYCIEVALAGFTKKEIQLYIEDNFLYIKHEKEEDECCDESYVHKGIAKRSFCLTFKILEQVVVDSATMANGLLKVCLKKVEPELDRETITIK